MGRNLPPEDNAALDWLEAHIDTWQANPPAIGLTQAQVDALADTIIKARADRTNANTARTEAISRTRAFTKTAQRMRAQAAPLIANIKNFADNAQSPSAVYQAASILPKDPRAPLPAPSKPVITARTLTGDGAVTLKWTAKGPTGTVYVISRRRDATGPFVIVGHGHGQTKAFTDRSLPAGTRQVSYIVQGVRGEKTGPPSNATTLFFGTPSSKPAAPLPALPALPAAA